MTHLPCVFRWTCTPRAAVSEGGCFERKAIAWLEVTRRSPARQLARDMAGRARGHLERGRPQHRRVAGRIDLVTAVGTRCPPPAPGMQPICGRKLAAGSLPAASLPRKTAVLEVLIPGLTGCPASREDDVECALRQLGIGSPDDVALRAGELPLRLGAAGRRHPRPGDGHARLKAVALARRGARRAGGDEGCGRDRASRSSRLTGSPAGTSRTRGPSHEQKQSASPAKMSCDLPVLGRVTEPRGSFL